MGLDKKERPYKIHDLHRAQATIDGGPPGGRDAMQYAGELEILLEDFRGKKVLDLGAGSELGLARGLKKIGIDCEVHSLSPAFAEPGPAQDATAYIQDDAGKLVVAGMGEEMPYKDGSFDLIIGLHVVEHIPSEERLEHLLDEIARVLKPGGIAHIGPIPKARPTHFDEFKFLVNKTDMQSLLGARNKIDTQWRPNKPPFELIVASDRYARYTEQCYVLTLTKKD